MGLEEKCAQCQWPMHDCSSSSRLLVFQDNFFALFSWFTNVGKEKPCRFVFLLNRDMIRFDNTAITVVVLVIQPVETATSVFSNIMEFNTNMLFKLG